VISRRGLFHATLGALVSAPGLDARLAPPLLDEETQGGLAVVDIPTKFVEAAGGRCQMRVLGTLNGKPFTGATMLVRDGGFCVGVTNATMSTANIAVGDTVTVSVKPGAK
jgi:hypothetical protein